MYLIDDYNALAKKHKLETRLAMMNGKLVMGREEQICANTYECVLSESDQSIQTLIVSCMLKQLCFEYGE